MNKMEISSIIEGTELVFTNARIVLGDEIVNGHVRVVDGQIVAIDTGKAPRAAIDFEGDYLLPGLVDIHTDHFEKHVYPRAHVRWDFVRAALAHDAQIIGSGVTTVFDSLCVGATYDNPERRKILAPMIDALETCRDAGMLKAEHFVHLRCEISDEETPNLVEANIGRDIVKVVSVMEHLPGVRQSRDLTHYIERNKARTGESEAVIRARIDQLLQDKSAIGAAVRPKVIALAQAYDFPLLSHDDTEEAHILEAKAEGVTISEFPCTMEAALAAHAHGMKTVAGAPNVLRGGSQSGNIAVSELLEARLVDILASDYVPRSLLDCAFMIGMDEQFDYTLPEALRMVATAPARAAGFADRGEIAIGQRADLLRVGTHAKHPFVKTAWLAGERVL